jgi:hypothetical protein
MMKKWFAHQLRRLADWLDPVEPVAPLVPTFVLEQARSIVATVDLSHHTGSYKRALAVKAMRMALPDVPRRDVALAIELAVREVPK